MQKERRKEKRKLSTEEKKRGEGQERKGANGCGEGGPSVPDWAGRCRPYLT